MVYYGIFNDGTIINNHNLEDLAQVPGLEYFVKLEYLPGGANFSVFTLINFDGKLNFLRINDVELRNIGTQYWDNYNKMTMSNFTFYDYKLNQTFQTPLSTHLGARFVKNDLIPFMESYVNNVVKLDSRNNDDQIGADNQRQL